MTDLDIIKQIEKILKVKLKKLNRIVYTSKGYILNQNGQITGIGLNNCKIKNLKLIISPLKDLVNLKKLQLSKNELSDISPLEDLNSLTRLWLHENQVNDISPLKDLKNLTCLDLRYNQLINIFPLKNLMNLKELNLGNNQVKDTSPLRNLINLRVLYIWQNRINDISTVKRLKGLTHLSLIDNPLSDISPLINLKGLKELLLTNTGIKDISPLKDLKKLTGLGLGKNKLSDISPLKDLKKLKRLDLFENPIEELQPWITDFNMKIRWESLGDDGYISFYGNPLKSPPPEIIKQGKEALKNYFEQLKEQEEDYLFEAKMLIVGEPGAGKTSMTWKMENPDCALPKEDETTKGIDVRQYYFPLKKEDFSAFKHPEKLESRKFRLNLWDFGGQEIYKATHRFFLSKRSLYALVADSRNEDTDFNYWLHIVEMFGGESPLLIVLNEKHQRKRNLDIEAMRKRFANISEVIDVDFADEDKTRLDKLERAVKYYVSQLPLVGSPVPAKWTVIREALENDKRNTITLQDYLKISKDNGVTKSKDALVLSQYFHDIGVFLHFQDDDLLKKLIFLNSNWATNAVYEILDHKLLNQKNGRFNREDANKIWSEDEYEFVRDELLRLMKKFFLTYEIENSNEYIVPERLPSSQPEYSWKEKDNLFLGYEYDLFMPKGIMSLFIVRMNRYINNHDHVWMRGLVLEREKTTAEIIETYDARRIKIRISGKNRRDFMTIITEEIDRINSPYEKMKVDKMIPCCCNECKSNPKLHFYEYKDLKRRIEKGKKEVECGKSYEMVNVRSLIDEVINEELRSSGESESTPKQSNGPAKKDKRNRVFVSYSHKDKKWLERVQTHLKVLESEGISVNLWDDTQIKAGMKWRKEIKKGMLTAKVAILLVSTDFLASDFIRKNELPPLLKSAEKDGAAILPVILKRCRYSTSKLAEFQAVNDPEKEPLSKLTEDGQDEILVKLTDRIAELIGLS